jgi:hypothetical protein
VRKKVIKFAVRERDFKENLFSHEYPSNPDKMELLYQTEVISIQFKSAKYFLEQFLGKQSIRRTFEKISIIFDTFGK